MKLSRFAIFTAFSVFILLVIGGLVNPTGSSLACPDWPTCYGSFFPEMKNGVEFEHTHRVAATLVGIFTFALNFLVLRSKAYSKKVRRLSTLAAVLVVLQGVLGGITVLYKLPLYVSAGHLALAMGFFCLTVYLAFRMGREERASTEDFAKVVNGASAKTDSALPTLLPAFAFFAVYAQIVLGAFVRHLRAGRSCGVEFPLCGGSFWPEIGPQQVHMAHRYFGIFVALLVIVVARSVTRKAKFAGRVAAYRASLVAPTLVLVQFLLGVFTVTTFVELIPVTAHLAVGAVLLANMWVMYLDLLPKGEESAGQQRNTNSADTSASAEVRLGEMS